MKTPSRQDTLQTWIDWLLALHAQEIDLGLERVSQVARQLKVDRPAPFVISVAGTNGKGSSVAMLSAILKQQGYRVGTYTSPHILRFNERIQVNGEMVSDQQIVDAFVEIEAARGQTKLTYFEFSTLAALLIFKQADVGVAVLEVGLGGRLDAVNLVDADAALITAIDVDHIEWLGDDREQIAIEKAGITRSNCPAVCSDPLAPASLFDYAKKHQVPLKCLGVDFVFSQNEQAWSFSFAGNDVLSATWPLPALKGGFQLQNASGVLALLSEVYDRLPVSRSSVEQGLTQVSNPGRLQAFFCGAQSWLVDVAHNPQSAKALADYLASSPDRSKFCAVFSVLNDKDSKPMIQLMAPWIETWLIADLNIPRSSSLSDLHALLMECGVAESHIKKMSSIAEAVSEASGMDSMPALVWGSFFTVSQAMEALKVQQDLDC